ncbi:MAG: hypothetical protein AAF307_11780, partial [Pseudomonadota bacterium]
MPNTPVEWLADRRITNSISTEATQPTITQLSNGNVVIVWASEDSSSPTSTPGLDLRGQIYDPLGNEIGSEFRVNRTADAHDEVQPSITAIGQTGGFAVVYNDFETSTTFDIDTDVVIDVFNSSGGWVGGDRITGNAFSSAGTVVEPKIANASGFNVGMAWYNPTTGDVEFQAYRTDTLTEVGTQNVLFNGAVPSGSNGQGVNGVDIAVAGTGYVVAYANADPGSDSLVLAAVNTFGNAVSFGATGTSTITVASGIESIRDPNITELTNGNFLVTYVVDGSAAQNNSGIRGAIYESDGTFVTTLGTVATTVAGNQEHPVAVALPDGQSIIFWQDTDTADLHGQRFAANGSKIGTEFDVDDSGSLTYPYTDAVLLDDGRVQVAFMEDFQSPTLDSRVFTAIWDVRDFANAPDPNGYQVGTITADTITTQSGTERVFGHFGDDTIVLRLADALNIEE